MNPQHSITIHKPKVPDPHISHPPAAERASKSVAADRPYAYFFLQGIIRITYIAIIYSSYVYAHGPAAAAAVATCSETWI